MGRSKKIQKHRKRRTLRRVRNVKPKSHIGGNTPNYSFITYGDSNYIAAKERIVNEAKGMGCFNGQIKAYGPEDLSKEFFEKIGDIIKESRGAGYWIWKSYIVHDMLNKLKDNDILLYADAGCTLHKEGVNRLISYADMISPSSGFSVLAMRLKTKANQQPTLQAKVWTTSAIFDHFNISLDNPIAINDQILAGVSMYRKCPESLAVVKKWLDTAEKHPDLFGSKFDEESKKTNPGFMENRHDQAVFSIIVQMPPYNKTVKVIQEEIEGSLPSTVPIHASRSKSGGGNDLVSVIIPTYNRFKFLLNTIKSIKAQTYKNIEIIIVNDKSTEDDYYKHKFDNDITAIHLPKNSKEIYGYACAGHVRNEGIKVSKGKYIAFCDDDDIWLPSKLELQINAMNDTKCKMSCTDGFIGKGQYKEGDKYEKYNAERFYNILRNKYKEKGSTLLENGFPDIWKLEFIKIHNCIITTSVIVSKELLDRINNFKTVENGSEDYDCWLRALEHTDIAYVKEPCFYYDDNHGRGRQYGGNKIYISGEAFKNECKYNLDDRYSLKPIDSSLEENDRVFVKQGDINTFIQSKPSKKVILVVHNTDETFEDKHMDSVRPFTNKVYAVNSSAKDAIQIPLGFRDDTYTPHNVLDEVKASSENKRDILCLLNFSIGSDKNNERSIALDTFKQYDWAIKDTNNTPALHLDHKNEDTIRLRREFYTKLTKTKFVVCPFGAGKDTHRVYEALFFGAIPIIKTSFLDPLYKKLGECWIVNDWTDITEDACNKRWDAGGFKSFKNNTNEWFML